MALLGLLERAGDEQMRICRASIPDPRCSLTSRRASLHLAGSMRAITPSLSFTTSLYRAAIYQGAEPDLFPARFVERLLLCVSAGCSGRVSRACAREWAGRMHPETLRRSGLAGLARAFGMWAPVCAACI